jgi:ParB family transcriptional regulator, chromosome partitioning protein
MDFNVSAVPLDCIDTTDHTFKITTQIDSSNLVRSIGAIGLLQPPVILPKAGDFIVVSGFRRLSACNSLNQHKIPVRILDPGTSEATCARIAIADNALQRTLNIVEQSRAFDLIRRSTVDQSSWPKIAESAGLPGSQAAINRILPVAGMPDDLQKALVDGWIALPVALQIDRRQKDDAAALLTLLRSLNTGLNIQRELLALIDDISIRDGIPITEVVAREEIQAVMSKKESSASQKVQELRLLLKSERYPELSKAEAAFKRMLKSLKLNPRVRLQAPAFFEGKTYRLTLNIDSRHQLLSLTTDIEKIAKHPDLLPE